MSSVTKINRTYKNFFEDLKESDQELFDSVQRICKTEKSYRVNCFREYYF